MYRKYLLVLFVFSHHAPRFSLLFGSHLPWNVIINWYSLFVIIILDTENLGVQLDESRDATQIGGPWSLI